MGMIKDARPAAAGSSPEDTPKKKNAKQTCSHHYKPQKKVPFAQRSLRRRAAVSTCLQPLQNPPASELQSARTRLCAPGPQTLSAARGSQVLVLLSRGDGTTLAANVDAHTGRVISRGELMLQASQVRREPSVCF